MPEEITSTTCNRCGKPDLPLFDVFVNGLGWRERCASCCELDEPRGRPRPFPRPLPSAVVFSADNLDPDQKDRIEAALAKTRGRPLEGLRPFHNLIIAPRGDAA